MSNSPIAPAVQELAQLKAGVPTGTDKESQEQSHHHHDDDDEDCTTPRTCCR